MSMEDLQKRASSAVKANKEVVYGLTGIYFCYVVLGGINHRLHKHIYTGNENESVLVRLSKGQPVMFRKDVYEEFFSFKHYFTTYQIHVLTAGAWLLSGVYNLRNPPEYAGKNAQTGRALFDGWWHKRGSGYVYVVSSFIKGLTAAIVSYRSHSLGFARYPMIMVGMWDVVSLGIAMQKIIDGDVAGHKIWMIRNFGVGAGSIWARVFAVGWALFDLEFMKSVQFYQKMNNVVLCCGFLQGIIFSEWWVAKTDDKRKLWLLAQILNVVAYIGGARNVYKELRDEQMKYFEKTGLNPFFG